MFAGTFVIQERVPPRPDLAPVFTVIPPPLLGWAQHLEVSRLSDQTAATASSYLRRFYDLRPAAREQLGMQLAASVAAQVSPPPPPGTEPAAFLAAVLAVRRQREHARLLARQAAAHQGPAAQGSPGAHGYPGTQGYPAAPGYPAAQAAGQEAAAGRRGTLPLGPDDVITLAGGFGGSSPQASTARGAEGSSPERSRLRGRSARGLRVRRSTLTQERLQQVAGRGRRERQSLRRPGCRGPSSAAGRPQSSRSASSGPAGAGTTSGGSASR